jgi:transposase
MDLLHARCAGLDVHQKSVVGCARVQDGAPASYETRTFETTTRGLMELSEWLSSHRCTHVAMEATGVYWKPVWHVLEGDFELILANAQHIKNVPGRKSDVSDAHWIADLAAHGLVRASFVPPTETQQMRDLTRTRKQFIREQVRHTQRIQKTLEDANIKLTTILSDVMGQSGRKIIEALIAGETNPEKLAELTDYRVRASRSAKVEALRGRVTEHHRLLLRLHLAQLDALDDSIAEIDKEVERTLEPFRAKVKLLATIPGISALVAMTIVSEIGDDMTRFPTAGHLVSWAGLCPQMNESAGRRKSTRIRKGAPWLKTVLVQVAWCAVRKKDSYFKAQYHRIRSRRGSKKAIVAVAASILSCIHAMLSKNAPFTDLGSDWFERANQAKTVKRLLHRLAALGVEVEVKQNAA